MRNGPFFKVFLLAESREALCGDLLCLSFFLPQMSLIVQILRDFVVVGKARSWIS